MQQAIKVMRIFMKTKCAEPQVASFLAKLVIWRHGLAGSDYPERFRQGVNVGSVCCFMLCILSQLRRNIIACTNSFIISSYWFPVGIIHKSKVTDYGFSFV